MEKILFLAHTEPDGTAEPKRRSKRCPRRFHCGRPKACTTWGWSARDVQAAGRSSPGQAQRASWRRRRGLRPAPLCHRRSGCGSSGARGRARRSWSLRTPRAGPGRFPGWPQRLGGRVDTHVTAIAEAAEDPHDRWFYRQRMEAVLTRTQRPWLCCMEPRLSPPAWEGAPGHTAVELILVDARNAHHRHSAGARPKAEQQTIRPDAKLLFVAGAGWTKKQADGADPCAEAERLILGLPARRAGLAGQQQIAGGPERRRPGRAAIS